MKPLLYFLALVSVMHGAHAAGIALSPEKIQFTVYEREHGEKHLMLYNLNGAESEFSIKALNYGEFFEIIPKSGIIAGNGRQTITIMLKPGMKKGMHEAEFLAQISNRNSGVSVIAGAKAKASVTVEPQVIYDAGISKGPFVTAGIVAVGLLIFKALR